MSSTWWHTGKPLLTKYETLDCKMKYSESNCKWDMDKADHDLLQPNVQLRDVSNLETVNYKILLIKKD